MLDAFQITVLRPLQCIPLKYLLRDTEVFLLAHCDSAILIHLSLSLFKGRRSELAVVISKYESKAACVNLPRKIVSPYACEQVLQEIPASLQTIEFVDQKDRPSRTGYSKLPKYHEKGNMTYQLRNYCAKVLMVDRGLRAAHLAEPGFWILD